MAADAPVNDAVIRWARERAGLTIGEIASSLDVKTERFEAWEGGESRPTLRQAQDLAQRLHIPFGYLFLSEPPAYVFPLPDLRTRAGQATKRPSAALLEVVNDAIRKQDWYRELQESEGAPHVPFIGRFSLSDEPAVIATDIRATLKLVARLTEGRASADSFLSWFAKRAESAGILVLRNGIVGANTSRPLDPNEFQGFAMSDDLAPLVFVNTNDVRTAQVFTLAHEIAHLWLGQSGVSSTDYRQPYSEYGLPVERLCNRVAAEVLLPADSFLRHWDTSLGVESNIRNASKHYGVGRVAALIRARDLKLVKQDEYRSHSRILFGQIQHSRGGRKDSGGNFYSALPSRNSRTLTLSVMSAVREGRLLARDAADLLNVKTGTLAEVARRIDRGQIDA